MDRKKEFENMKEEYKKIKVPETGMEGLMNAIEQGKEERARRKKAVRFQKIGKCAVAMLLIGILLPNISADVAMAMEKVPGIGRIVRVITFGRYDFEDETHEAQVEIPQVEIEMPEEESGQKAEGEMDNAIKKTEDSMNQDIQQYIDAIIAEFEESIGDENYKALNITYETVTDTPEWFTLKIDVSEVEASGYMYSKYYHIDKTTGERAELKDLFEENADYVTPISENIKEQMREQMEADENKIYFIDSMDMPENDFKQIKEDQNFYFNENGEIVIVFDEYEAAPGYMGIVEFTIPVEAVDSIRVK